ncbi:MAG: hypothetical protein A3F13_04970 [Gammaproteobacteria bacterium RIFCSPHIGHO2_12_FULL_40_19]|nr:MAG: hypothetical protein A3F13_04970 [Gammaproteobacteria bacterium RIFCSPHIGHO2_12_FULL_40_19]
MINQEVIKQLIQDQKSIRLPDALIQREIWADFAPYQHNNQIIVIKGMRRCGKSTFMQWVRSLEKQPHYYFNFDDDRLVNFTVDDFQILLELFIELIGPAKIVFFDEIQNISGWERFIRRLHDQDYKIYLTGSNARLFSRELGTHLTGRTISIEMYPYSFSEYLAAKKITVKKQKTYATQEKGQIKNYFNQYAKMGGIPDYIRFEQPEYLNDLYESILYRDIIVRHNIGKEQALKSLVYYLASNIGKDVSFNKLKSLLKLASATTVSDYCYFIEMSYLCFFINQYSHSLKAQSHYGKKEYFVDQALAQRIGFRVSEDFGRTLENIVFIELKRRKYEIFFHKGNYECDFLIKEAHQITQAIQVTAHLEDTVTRQREFNGLNEAMSVYQLKNGLILTENTEFKEGNINVMPIWKWLLDK